MGLRKAILLRAEVCFHIGLWVNIGLTLFKIFVGITGHSKAMVADGLHSASDVVATFVVYLAYKSSKRPADATHPYGHEGIESLAAMGIALLLVVTGAYMIYSSVISIHVGVARIPSFMPLVAAVVSIVIKEAMFHYTYRVGKRENSPALISNAWDHRSDAISSLTAFAGIIGARSGRPFLDPAAGIAIAALIIFMAYKIMRENVGMLIDEPPGKEIFTSLGKVVEGVAGVEGIGDVKVRRRGSMYYVDLTIFVGDDLSVAEGHAIAEKVERELLSSGNRIHSSMVHVEPASSADNE